MPFMSAVPPARRQRRSFATFAAFGLGLPVAAGLLYLLHFGPLRQTPLFRYVSHPVECVEVTLFCCALGALLAKLAGWAAERRAFRYDVLPDWDGAPVPAAEAAGLLATLDRLPRRVQSTWLVKRVEAVLDFLCRRGSAADLDDQLRALADNDALAVENSYALIRFITWAIPILGFLGTVLGITEAIAGVTPEVLEQSLSSVTDGLALAFDTTAVALALTMVIMFLSYVTDRAEQGVLEAVDRYADRQLAHRFARTGPDGGAFVEVVRENTQVLLRATEQLVRRQAELWAKTLAEVHDSQAAAGQRLTVALEAALERTLHSHAQRLAAAEQQAGDRSARVLEQVARVAAGMAAQADALAGLQEGERQLLQLQELLAQNLEALAGAGTLDQAVHSLTAAVHLLTARAAGPGRGSTGRPGVAA
jgi:hypothetical protein